MSHHRFHGSGDVPFSWESKPGTSKVTPHMGEFPKAGLVGVKETQKLPPPPCPTITDSPKLSGHGMYIPLPPCPFQPPQSQRKGFRWEDDPFTAAYMECTKSVKKQGNKEKKRDRFGFSCKQTCGVVEDARVKLSQLSSRNSRGKRYLGMNSREGDPREHRSLIHE